MDWKKMVPGCFGAVDKEFALHPMDAERARKMLRSALDADASWTDIEAELRAYLGGSGCASSHIEKQIAAARDLQNYWP